MHSLLRFFILALSLYGGPAHAIKLDQARVGEFVEYMAQAYEFDARELAALFRNTRYSQRVITAMDRPAEALPWYKYRQLFLDSGRIEAGLRFWGKHQDDLARAELEFGVPAGMIVAIIGVETRYGENTGKDRIMDALATLAFHYPKRSVFFRNELEQFLLLTREQGLNPLSLQGSYAGAMGLPQFMPSSFRNYAVDFDHDGRIDIWNNVADAIGCVANYFQRHGWEPHQPVAVPARATGGDYQSLLDDDLRPHVSVAELAAHGIQQVVDIPVTAKVKLISLQGESGAELWLGLNNFYVITRYNRSPLYAMAVYQLYEEIVKHYQPEMPIH